MNVITRRMQCFACGREYDVTPWYSGTWRETMVNRDAPQPFIIAARLPICADPLCQGKELVDMNSERVNVDSGAIIVIDSCERPYLN